MYQTANFVLHMSSQTIHKVVSSTVKEKQKCSYLSIVLLQVSEFVAREQGLSLKWLNFDDTSVNVKILW